jgi:hypothetical protein
VSAASSDLLIALVQWTARASAVILVAALAAGAADLLAPLSSSSASHRGSGWKLVGALIVSHTIHFAFVAALTLETHGQNVVNRGGWMLASVVGVLFYVATVGALVLRRVPPASRPLANVAGDAVCSVLVGLAFLEIYGGRAGRSPGFALMAALLAVALIIFVVAAGVHVLRRSPAGPVTSGPG